MLNKGFGYNNYTKLYHSGAIPILDYCSSVWGYCNLDKIDILQNRALRVFLGVHKFAANEPKQCNPKAVHIKMWTIQGVHIKNVDSLATWRLF